MSELYSHVPYTAGLSLSFLMFINSYCTASTTAM